LIEDELIYRDEVVALLFNVADMARSLERLEGASEAKTMAKKRPTKADLEARRQMVENAERTRRLAERGRAELERQGRWEPMHRGDEKLTPREERRRMRENAERTRRLAEKAQAELDRQAGSG
jgi:colicin import membrane protein